MRQSFSKNLIGFISKSILVNESSSINIKSVESQSWVTTATTEKMFIHRERTSGVEREIERQQLLELERAKTRELRHNLDLERERQTQVITLLLFGILIRRSQGYYLTLGTHLDPTSHCPLHIFLYHPSPQRTPLYPKSISICLTKANFSPFFCYPQSTYIQLRNIFPTCQVNFLLLIIPKKNLAEISPTSYPMKLEF